MITTPQDLYLLTTREITLKYIRSRFDLEQECKSISVEYIARSVDFLEGDYTSSKLAECFDLCYGEVIRISSHYSGLDFDVIAKRDRLETHSECEIRLQKEVKSAIKHISDEKKERAEYERLKAIYA